MADIRICFVGDSFVNGTGDPEYLGWTGRVCAAVEQPITHYNLGIRGNTSQQIETRWQMEAKLRLPSGSDARMMFSFGANDARMDAGAVLVKPRESFACARRILARSKAQYPTLMMGVPPVEDRGMNLRIKEISLAYAEICAEIAVPYLDVFTPLSENLIWMREVALVDGAHPAAAGYRELASIVLEWSAWKGWFKS
ncbi:MAG: GDSL-type esterase/lipase family protein [Cyanobacteria bacterium P01_D01_bin.105]